MRRRPCARLAAGEDRSGRQETMIFRKSILAAAVVAAMVMPAAAQQSEVLFQHKHWRVELVAWDDGVLGCQATVGTDSESFSLWTFQDSTVQMQFYSKSWDFGEGDSADLQVQVGRLRLHDGAEQLVGSRFGRGRFFQRNSIRSSRLQAHPDFGNRGRRSGARILNQHADIEGADAKGRRRCKDGNFVIVHALDQ